jgi:hypothetical protein
VAVAVVILWRLSSRSVPPVSFDETGMRLQSGDCRLHLPLKQMKSESFTADVLTIDRTIATLPNGYRLVDEKISMPENYTFGKALSALVEAVFGLKGVHTLLQNDKMVLFEERDPGERPFRVLAIYKGKHDLELLYPLNDSLVSTIGKCLIGKRKAEGPTILNHLAESDESPLPLSRWDQNLFDLDILVNKDM